MVLGKPSRITVQNFVKIGQSVVKILRFFNFQDNGHPPSWIYLGHIWHSWTTRTKYLGFSITLLNLVMIDIVVLII